MSAAIATAYAYASAYATATDSAANKTWIFKRKRVEVNRKL